jgi:hypothetical protein
MAVWRFVNIDIKEAQLLADLTGIQNDLEATDAICDLLMKEINKGQYDMHLVDALSSAALVRYARSFSSGMRKTKMHESIQNLLSPELLKEHKWFINLRDKYVAHSVNAFEDNQVVAYLVPEERGPKGIASISVQQTRLASLGGADVTNLRALCAELRKDVEVLIGKERTRVLEAAKQIPIERLYSQKDPPPRLARKSDVAKPRKRK